ncbi:HTH_48 domain-containing protein [Trichonephila clavipes]|nr:HTH_48 domain-containing protein [Trichonephila clavipes]
MMKTAFGEEAMSRARVFEVFQPFKEGRQSVNSDPRSGRPTTSRNEDKIAQVKAVVRSDRRLTVRDIAHRIIPTTGPLFPKIKNTIKGHRFQDIETIKQNSTQQLQAIPKSEFQKCFEDWRHRWAKRITANGAYFEGD